MGGAKRSNHGLGLALLLSAVLLLGGCLADQDRTRGEVTPDWDFIQSTIFESSCAVSGCHTGSTPAGGLSLDANQYSTVVDNATNSASGLQYVNSGFPSQSYLYLAITNQANGDDMSGFVSQGDVDLIKQWIEAGAPESVD